MAGGAIEYRSAAAAPRNASGHPADAPWILERPAITQRRAQRHQALVLRLRTKKQIERFVREIEGALAFDQRVVVSKANLRPSCAVGDREIRVAAAHRDDAILADRNRRLRPDRDRRVPAVDC